MLFTDCEDPITEEQVHAFEHELGLVAVHRLVPRHFFPFAVDGGGDVLFVDCSTLDGSVYLYIHDTAFEHIIGLGVGLDGFWARLATD